MVSKMDNKESTEVSKKEDTLFIRFNIVGDTKDMFLHIKKHYNLRYNMETFRMMVKKIYDQITSE